MSKTSVVMLGNTAGQVSVIGEKIRADGWYGHTDGLHTVSIYTMNFTGRVWFEASIASDPSEADWFPIDIKGSTYLIFPRNAVSPTGPTGDTGTIGINIVGNFTWLRACMDRVNNDPITESLALSGRLGVVDRVLINN